jgi:3-methylfumaryl-CoA hydratase
VLIDIDELRRWQGKSRESVDIITPRVANSLAAILDDKPLLGLGDIAPLGIHWCLSPDMAAMSELGSDGHPARGGFLPPVPLPRRMWAGGDLVFTGSFHVGDTVHRKSMIEHIGLKEGRTGDLCFVTLRHVYSVAGEVKATERQDIVYRGMVSASVGALAVTSMPEPDQSFPVEATSALLMRYSAATFNGHRIHYDREYCMSEEGYPGLVVHGPLQATFLLRLAAALQGGRIPDRFTFRGMTPLFDGEAFSVCGTKGRSEDELWVRAQSGVLTMKAAAIHLVDAEVDQ